MPVPTGTMDTTGIEYTRKLFTIKFEKMRPDGWCGDPTLASATELSQILRKAIPGASPRIYYPSQTGLLNIAMETKREDGANELSTAEKLVNNDVHLLYMRKALDEARKCTHVPTAFCVGCLIVIPGDESDAENEGNRSATTFSPALSVRSKGFVIAAGYSRELPGNTHAEANALSKARRLASLPSPLSVPPLSSSADAESNPSLLSEQGISDLLARSSIYTTLEPCSVRTSGLAPCANAILDAKIKKCYIGAPEPPDFVTCEGAKILRDAGVEVVWVKGLEDECLSVARGEF